MDQWVSEGLIEADPSPSCEHDQARGLLFWEPAAPSEKNTGWGWRAPGQGQQGRSGLPFMGSGFPHMSLGWKEGDGSMAYPLGEQRSLFLVEGPGSHLPKGMGDACQARAFL